MNHGDDDDQNSSDGGSPCVENGRPFGQNSRNHTAVPGECNSGGAVKKTVAGGEQKAVECQPCGEYVCVYTDLPKFLVTYSPKVQCKFMLYMYTCICTDSTGRVTQYRLMHTLYMFMYKLYTRVLYSVCIIV